MNLTLVINDPGLTYKWYEDIEVNIPSAFHVIVCKDIQSLEESFTKHEKSRIDEFFNQNGALPHEYYNNVDYVILVDGLPYDTHDDVPFEPFSEIDRINTRVRMSNEKYTKELVEYIRNNRK